MEVSMNSSVCTQEGLLLCTDVCHMQLCVPLKTLGPCFLVLSLLTCFQLAFPSSSSFLLKEPILYFAQIHV